MTSQSLSAEPDTRSFRSDPPPQGTRRSFFAWMIGIVMKMTTNIVVHGLSVWRAWARKEYDKVGYEFKAAAHALKSAAGWAGTEAKAGAAVAVGETKALGDKLASGAIWTREEVAKGFESLGNAINALGQDIGGSKKAAPVHVGS